MNKIIVMCLCLASLQDSHAQSAAGDTTIFNNDSVRFRLVLTTPMAGAKHHPKNTYTVRMMMSEEQKKYLLGLDPSFWIQHLYAPGTDWGTNLILYCIYDVDASSIAAFPNREKWLQVKAGEIEKWKTFFSKRGGN